MNRDRSNTDVSFNNYLKITHIHVVLKNNIKDFKVLMHLYEEIHFFCFDYLKNY